MTKNGGGERETDAVRSIPGRLAWLLPLVLVAMAAVFPYRLKEDLTRPVRDHGAGDTIVSEISRRPEFAFGFRNALGDLAWLGAVQVAGGRRTTREEYDRLAELVGCVNRLDPRFDIPYFLGGLVLTDSPHHAVAALKILERGWANHPANWRFPYYVGYVHYFSLGNPLEGGEALRAASMLPDSPPYLPLLATRMLVEGRDPGTALMFLAEMLRNEQDPSRRRVLEGRIREVLVERDLQALERAVSEYRARTGRPPAELADLVRSGILRNIPDEPNGGRYLLGADGGVRSDRIARRLRVFRKSG